MTASAAQIAFLVVAVALVPGASWSFSRSSAPLLFDLLDSDEMLAAAAHRLLTVGHLLLGGGLAFALMPSASPRSGDGPALFSATASLLALLALGHLGLVVATVRLRSVRSARELTASRPWNIPGATPPTVPMPRPVFSAPPQPPMRPAAFYPPSPPPWCRPLPQSYDPWAPPPR